MQYAQKCNVHETIGLEMNTKYNVDSVDQRCW
jgi:hypothetical protein